MAPLDSGPTPIGAGGDVTALHALPARRVLLAGVGSILHALDSESGARLAAAVALPAGARVHGLRSLEAGADGDYLLAVHGDVWVAGWRLKRAGTDGPVTLTRAWTARAPSWAHDALPLPDGRGGCASVAVGTADNAVSLARWDEGGGGGRGALAPLAPLARCPARGVLYSMALLDRGPSGSSVDLWVAAGTAFLEVAVWRVPRFARRGGDPPPAPSTVPAPLLSLAGHTGSIHRVVWAPGGARLASASDDRSVRVWAVDADGSPPPPPAVLAGHGARLWDVAFLEVSLEAGGAPVACVASACEDGAARVWPLDGAATAPSATLRAHTGRGVWRLAVLPGGRLATAGADGAAHAWRVGESAAAALLPFPTSTPPITVHCLAPAAAPDSLLVGTRAGEVWRVGVAGRAWARALAGGAGRGSATAVASAPCWRCEPGGVGLLVLAGLGRGGAALACDCASARAPTATAVWHAAPPSASSNSAHPITCVALVCRGRLAVTASPAGDVAVWAVPRAGRAAPTALATAPPRRARRKDAAVSALVACEASGLLFAGDAAGGVCVFRLPAARGGRGRSAAPPPGLVVAACTTTPGAAAVTALALEPGPTLAVGDAAGRVTLFRVDAAPGGAIALSRCGGFNPPCALVASLTPARAGREPLVAGFVGREWRLAAPARGGLLVARQPDTGGWRRGVVLVQGEGKGGGRGDTLVWTTAGAALAARALGPLPPAFALAPGHGLDVNAVAIVAGGGGGGRRPWWRRWRRAAAAAPSPPLLLTAGEDGELGVTRLVPSASPAAYTAARRAGGLTDGAALRGLAVVPSPTDPARRLAFAASAGGGGAWAWRVWPADGRCEWGAGSSARGAGNARVAAASPRATAVVAITTPPASRTVTVFVATAAGGVDVRRYDDGARAFASRPPLTLPAHAGAALCMATAPCGHTVLVVTGGSDGRVVVWDGGGVAAAATADSPSPPAPLAALAGLHQSGVLALAAATLPAGGGALVASGGDDQALALVWLDARGAPAARAVLPAAHASAVRGVWTDGRELVSVGLDGELVGWRVGARGAPPVRAWARRAQVPAPTCLAGAVDEKGGRLLVVGGRGSQVWAG